MTKWEFARKVVEEFKLPRIMEDNIAKMIEEEAEEVLRSNKSMSYVKKISYDNSLSTAMDYATGWLNSPVIASFPNGWMKLAEVVSSRRVSAIFFSALGEYSRSKKAKGLNKKVEDK